MAFPSDRYHSNRASEHTLLDRWVKKGLSAFPATPPHPLPPRWKVSNFTLMAAVHTWPQVTPTPPRPRAHGAGNTQDVGEKPALTVLRLPPGLQPVGGKGGDHVLDPVVAHRLRLLLVGLSRVAHKALFLLLVEDTQESQGLKPR